MTEITPHGAALRFCYFFLVKIGLGKKSMQPFWAENTFDLKLCARKCKNQDGFSISAINEIIEYCQEPAFFHAPFVHRTEFCLNMKDCDLLLMSDVYLSHKIRELIEIKGNGFVNSVFFDCSQSQFLNSPIYFSSINKEGKREIKITREYAANNG